MARDKQYSVFTRSESVHAFQFHRSALFSSLLKGVGFVAASLAAAVTSTNAWSEEAAATNASPAERKQIEEVVVTAERKEASISDTSISITAFTGQMLEDLGIRNQEDLQNMIPAAVIQPYDMAIRGIGRNFRNLGGDPGIATYLNSVYSEDFGIASTEGGLFDIERIEVLRGPQGTLYGRNAIGGAVNFISKRPTDEFEGQARVITGTDGLQEEYGFLSGPMIPGVLDARATGSKRVRDGYVDDLSGNQNPDNYGDENYALSLLFTPNDDFSWYVRGNDRSYRRRMGGADAAGIVNFTQPGNYGNVGQRDTSTYIFAMRGVDPAVSCATAADPSGLFTRTAPVSSPGVRGGLGCTIPGQQTFQFTNPTTGAIVNAQRVVAGVDGGSGGVGTNGLTADNVPNFAYGANPALQRMLGLSHLSGGDLKTDTSGLQNEGFDQHAGTSEMSYKINDQLTLKYIFGYSSFFYDRNTDTDLTSSSVLDQQFYVSQEANFTSHELQAFWDPSDKLSITSGLFYYTGTITQRGNFWDSLCKLNQPCDSKYANPAFGTMAAPVPYAAISPLLGFMDGLPQMQLLSAKYFGQRFNAGAPPTPGLFAGFNCLPGLFATKTSAYCFGSWQGSENTHVTHENPFVPASVLQYQTHTERTSYAAYTQGVYTFNEHWALTLGARWARDMLDGEENDWYYNEDNIVALGFPGANPDAASGACAPTCGSSLAAVNQAFGYLGASGQVLNPNRLLVAGVPDSIDLWRALNRKDDDITWRINLDFTPTDRDLIYLSATKGSRAGGFNLVFFSANASYKTESLISYELGYKGTMRDGTLQLNSAIYYYDYKNVETFGTGPSAFNPQSTSTSVFSVPSAAIIGWDTDIDWLITDRLTLGANWSYTHSEYTDHFNVDDPNNPARPPSLFNPQAAPIDLNGKQMLQVPEMKGGMYLQYTYPLPGDRGTLTGLVNWSWIDKVYFSAFEANLDAAPSYDRTDLRLTWNSAGGAWLIAGFVNNVFNDIGIRQVDHYGSTEDVGFIRNGATTDPRTAGLEVSFKFGALK
jgi:outer membrane receptor protein involved in Fe transport